jgi:pyrophosphate--fructose-6-phosphate 1-phosphotransferase
MGRSASHIALECALQTQPNVALISEEVEAKKHTLQEIVKQIADVIAHRAANEENFGSVLIPEGLIEFIPEMKILIAELNDIMAHKEEEFVKIESKLEKREFVATALSPESAVVYGSLPTDIADQLIMDRDPHGNVQVSRIETDKLLIEMVEVRLKKLRKKDRYVGSFAAQNHFFGYEGRCAAPSNFDADYTYSLGFTAAVLIGEGKTGYMASIRNTTQPASEWIAGGVPTTMMMNMERRHGAMKPVIQKALVDLDGAPFKSFEARRDEWAKTTSYIYPGPIQYFGPAQVCDAPTKTLALEKSE